MSFKKLITSFVFTEQNREQITLSDSTKIRLNAEDVIDPVIMLKAVDGLYPTDADLYAITIIKTPNDIKQWQGIEILFAKPANTAVELRFTNGTREIYWDGGAWVTAGASDWNTEEDVRTNISTFPFDNNSIGVVLNLSTSDETVSPEVQEVKLLGLFDIDEYQDAVVTLMQRLHDQFRPLTDAAASVLTTTATFDLNGDYKLDNVGYNIIDVVAVYDLTADPLKKSNLVDSYTPGAVKTDGETFEPGVVTTISSITAGNIVLLKIQYVPEVADHTDEDFYEIGKVPTINLERIEEFNRRDGLGSNEAGSGIVSGGDSVRDIPNLTAVQVQPPAQIDLRVEYAIFTDKSMDQKRMAATMETFLQNNRLLYSLGRDEPFSLQVGDRLKTQNKGAAGNLMKATGSFDLRGVSLFSKPSLELSLVDAVNVDITT